MKVAFIGGGNMGSTYARAFVRSSIVPKEDLLIIDKSPELLEKLDKEGIFTLHNDIDEKLSDVDYIFVAVKPQNFLDICPALKKVLHKKQVVISVMAGLTIKFMKENLDHENIIRAMPNTPAQLGFGVTGFCAAKSVSQKVISKIDQLLETTGKSIFIKEKDIDALTAISGSGPAYFFYFMKYIQEAGAEMGLESHVANMLARQTMLGAFHMLNDAKVSPDELIANVKSKRGTTEAALDYMANSDVGPNIKDALKAAQKRARELTEEISSK